MGLIIEDIPYLFIHEMAKDPIGRIQDSGLTSEIFLEENQFAILWMVLVQFEFAVENEGICLTETVDGLLNIPHHKAIVAIGEEFQQAFLHVVVVLVLIHHDFVVLVFENLGYAGIVLQNLDSKMGDVVEFEGIFLEFGGQILGWKLLDKVSEELQEGQDVRLMGFQS